MVAKGDCPHELTTRERVPAASWEGWNHVAADLGIHAGGASAQLVFEFVDLMEDMSEQVAAGHAVSDTSRRRRDKRLSRLAAAYAVRSHPMNGCYLSILPLPP